MALAIRRSISRRHALLHAGTGFDKLCSTDLTLSRSTIGMGDDFNVTVTVHNNGAVDGKEVVQVSSSTTLLRFMTHYPSYQQVYITDTFSSVVTPNQQLVGFNKVDVPYVVELTHHVLHVLTDTASAGSSRVVTIPISSSQLAVWSYNGWVVEPGNFNVKIGTSEDTYINTTLIVQ